MIAAVCGPSAARNASRSTPPSAADGIVTVRKPAIVAVAGLVPCDESGTRTSVRSWSPRDAVVGADHQDAGQLAVGAGGRLERDRGHAADLGQHRLELAQQLERALGERVGRQRVRAPRSRAAARPTR